MIDHRIKELLKTETVLPDAGSYGDYGNNQTMGWVRAALKVLLEAELERQEQSKTWAV